MVELYCVLSVANFHHDLLVGIPRQYWLASYGTILRTVTDSCKNVRENHTMLANARAVLLYN